VVLSSGPRLPAIPPRPPAGHPPPHPLLSFILAVSPPLFRAPISPVWFLGPNPPFGLAVLGRPPGLCPFGFTGNPGQCSVGLCICSASLLRNNNAHVAAVKSAGSDFSEPRFFSFCCCHAQSPFPSKAILGELVSLLGLFAFRPPKLLAYTPYSPRAQPTGFSPRLSDLSCPPDPCFFGFFNPCVFFHSPNPGQVTWRGPYLTIGFAELCYLLRVHFDCGSGCTQCFLPMLTLEHPPSFPQCSW